MSDVVLVFEFAGTTEAQDFTDEVLSETANRMDRSVRVSFEDPTDLELEDARNLAAEYGGRETK